MKGLFSYVFRLAIGLTFFTVTSWSTTQAQEQRAFKFALLGSPTASWFKTTNEGWESNGAQWGLSYGAQMDFVLKGNDHYYVSSGLFVTSAGGRLSMPGVSNYQGNLLPSTHDYIVRSNYLEIPLGIKMRSSEIGYSHIAGNFGFSSGFKLADQQEVSTTAHAASGDFNNDWAEGVSELSLAGARFGIQIGMEWERRITGDTYFVLGASFSNGLTNVVKGNAYVLDSKGDVDLESNYSDGSPKGQSLKVHNKALLLHLGVYF